MVRSALALCCLASMQVVHADQTDLLPASPSTITRQGPQSLPALHADIKFSVAAPVRSEALDASTHTALLARQSLRLATSLEAAARGLYSDAMRRIDRFDVYVAESADIATRSSSTGKIALNAGLANLRLTDDSLAFVIAREMGHVLAGHHEDNSTASIVTSVLMNILLPGSGLIKSAVSLASSELASASGGERQLREADEIAIRLLETSGYRMHNVALSLATESFDPALTGTWIAAFRNSAAQIAAKARPAPSPSAPATGVALAIAGNPDAPLTTIALPTRFSEEPAVRARPSGVPGPLILGGHLVPARRPD